MNDYDSFIEGLKTLKSYLGEFQDQIDRSMVQWALNRNGMRSEQIIPPPVSVDRFTGIFREPEGLWIAAVENDGKRKEAKFFHFEDAVDQYRKWQYN